MKYSKILVCSPTAVTGGPELLHQLVDELRRIGHDAYIVYFPFDQAHECPDPYRCYVAPQSSLIDEPDVMVVVPEVATWIARKFKKAQVAVWWLSVDAYFGWRGESKLRDFCVYLKGYIWRRTFFQRRIPIAFMKSYIHLAQSEYARDFLARKGIASVMITDYLNDLYLDGSQSVDVANKEDIICYNPKKGIRRTEKLIQAYPEFEFIPIEGLSMKGVYQLLCRSKIYIDFGNHPGKDRLPREAAMAGCCVITGRRGSARNDIDVPLPQRYKLDDSSDNYIAAFGDLAQEVFSNFPAAYRAMGDYRSKIKCEKQLFKQQVRDFFGVVNDGGVSNE